MEINEELLKKLAKNARLELSEKEIKEFLPQLKEILHSFSVLNEAPIQNLHASFQPLLIKNVFREDKIEGGLTQEEALKNTEHKKDGFFKGPKVM